MTNARAALLVILCMCALGTGGVLLLQLLRPDNDNTGVIATIIGFLAPTTAALLAYLKSADTHKLVNGQLTEYKRTLQENALRDIADARAAAYRDASTQRSGYLPAGPEEYLWHVMNVVLVSLETGEILRISRAAERLFGYGMAGELIGKPIETLVPVALAETHRAHVQRYRERPEPREMGAALELRGRKRDGAEFPVAIQLTPLARDGVACALAVIVAKPG